MTSIFFFGPPILHLNHTTQFPLYHTSLHERKTSRKQVPIVGASTRICIANSRVRWSPEEDEVLLFAIEQCWLPELWRFAVQALSIIPGGPVIVWSQVSACLPGRNSKSCRKRWVRSLDPTLRKGPSLFRHQYAYRLIPTSGRWTEEEDALLTTAVETYGTQWFQVAKMLHGRTDDQCAKRWRENLDPSISRKPWTKEDDELLMKTYENIGRRWKDLASHFEGRPPVHCRNRVQSLVRARRRAIAASRKAAQAKHREKPAVDKEVVKVEFDCATGVRIITPA